MFIDHIWFWLVGHNDQNPRRTLTYPPMFIGHIWFWLVGHNQNPRNHIKKHISPYVCRPYLVLMNLFPWNSNLPSADRYFCNCHLCFLFFLAFLPKIDVARFFGGVVSEILGRTARISGFTQLKRGHILYFEVYCTGIRSINLVFRAPQKSQGRLVFTFILRRSLHFRLQWCLVKVFLRREAFGRGVTQGEKSGDVFFFLQLQSTKSPRKERHNDQRNEIGIPICRYLPFVSACARSACRTSPSSSPGCSIWWICSINHRVAESVNQSSLFLRQFSPPYYKQVNQEPFPLCTMIKFIKTLSPIY